MPYLDTSPSLEEPSSKRDNFKIVDAAASPRWEARGLLDVGTAAAMTKDEEDELRAQLARLRQEHRDLDSAIEALQDSPGSDLLQVQRLKKRKLQLRDRINALEDQLTPDIIA
jgi:hypothetical protein